MPMAPMTRTTNPMTCPRAILLARSAGAAAIMATVTAALSTLVPANAPAARPSTAGKPADIPGSLQSAGRAGRAGPKGRSPRKVIRCAYRGASP